jgi:hypothetical protein
MVTGERTIKDWLVELGKSSQSTDEDSETMQNVLRGIGFPKAVVTCGIVYFDGAGDNADIHSVAKILVREVRIDYKS